MSTLDKRTFSTIILLALLAGSVFFDYEIRKWFFTVLCALLGFGASWECFGMLNGPKQFKGLKKESLRDNMTNTELILNMLAESAATDLSREQNPKGFTQSAKVAKKGGSVAKAARDKLESQLGHSVISPAKAKDFLPPALRPFHGDAPSLRRLGREEDVRQGRAGHASADVHL